MRQALRANKAKKPPTFTIQEPAPIEGWTSQESFAEAEPTSAVILTNLFPEADAIRARRGHTEHASGLGADVTTLIRFLSASLSKMFGAVATSIFEVTSSGAVGAAVLTGMTNGRWQQTMFATPAGQFTVMCNGADGVWTYDGTTWTERTTAITGVSADTFINVTAHKERLWFVPLQSTDLWYLDTQAILGAAHKFPVGSFLHEGGYIVAMGTYSVDAGQGMDDLFVAVSSMGEALLYAGTDPAAASTWQLVGNYHLGKPIGRRCLFQVAGDLLVISEDGIIPMSKILKVDRAVMGKEAVTSKIRQAYVNAVKRSQSQIGWEIVASPHHNMALCNVPASGSTPVQQFAFNTITGGWGLFTGLDANCWTEFDGGLYFGGNDGFVYRAEYGANDNGAAIPITLLPAFSHLKSPGRLKQIRDFRFYITTDITSFSYEVAVAVDYEEPLQISGAAGSPSIANFFQWDVTPWDGPAVWYGETIVKEWTGAQGLGTVVAPYMHMNLDAGASGAEFKFRIIATDFIYEPGGVIG